MVAEGSLSDNPDGLDNVMACRHRFLSNAFVFQVFET